MRLRLLAMSAASAIALLSANSVQADNTGNDSLVVKTTEGPVAGVQVGTLRAFLGIPYAAPPVGALRWQPPQPHASWTTPLDASAFGQHCPQPQDAAQASASEDCLFLNVYAPQASQDNQGSLPVMVWIQGGSLVTGKSDDFDPTPLIQRGNVVVVTLNYRLGALGFLAQAALDAEGHKFANYGLMDQQFALQWVQRNATAFGGNPHNVTIFGTSAGGQSVTSHLEAPDSAGLFQRAIVESGAYLLSLPPLAVAETQGANFASTVGCSDQTAACLRATNSATLVAHEANAYGTTLDGQVLTLSPMQAFGTGQFNRVPVLQGSNHDEFRLFVAQQFDLHGGPLTAAGYPGAIAAFPMIGPRNEPQVFAEYPLADYPSPDLAYATAIGDQSFSCSARTSNQLLSRWVPTYAYEFNDPNAPTRLPLPPVSFPYGATHGSEVLYLFKVAGINPTFSQDQQTLASIMQGYWTRFAAVANPNSFDAPSWQNYSVQADGIQSLVPPRPDVEFDFASQHHCAFWHNLLPAFD